MSNKRIRKLQTVFPQLVEHLEREWKEIVFTSSDFVGLLVGVTRLHRS